MSVAFTKEESAETAAETILPDRPVSPHANLVTAAGLAALEQDLARARAAFEQAMAEEDVNERRRQQAGPARDIRYLVERLRTADLRPDPDQQQSIVFGATVRFEREDGRIETYRIVGEDEADPKAGRIAYVAPVARALMGKTVGDIVAVAGHELEILSIS